MAGFEAEKETEEPVSEAEKEKEQPREQGTGGEDAHGASDLTVKSPPQPEAAEKSAEPEKPAAETPGVDTDERSTVAETEPSDLRSVTEEDPKPRERTKSTADPAKIRESLTFRPQFYSKDECTNIESWIDDTVLRAGKGLLGGTKTLDVTPSRGKYFFGHGYTYGRGMRGKEELLPRGSVAAIPGWMRSYVVGPLEKKGIIKPGWVDSIVVNDYRSGSSIVSHIDPPTLFARPIVTVTFFCPAKLVFGASFDPCRLVSPAYSQMLTRGGVLVMDGYAANEVTHGIRPEDLLGARRVSLVLRHVIAAQPIARLPSSFAQNALGLLCKAQGNWQAPASENAPAKFYSVQGMAVTVLGEHNNGKSFQDILQLSDKELKNHPSFQAIWELVPAKDGLLCKNTILHRGGATERSLSWCMHNGEHLAGEEVEAEALTPCYTWVRAGN